MKTFQSLREAHTINQLKDKEDHYKDSLGKTSRHIKRLKKNIDTVKPIEDKSTTRNKEARHYYTNLFTTLKNKAEKRKSKSEKALTAIDRVKIKKNFERAMQIDNIKSDWAKKMTESLDTKPHNMKWIKKPYNGEHDHHGYTKLKNGKTLIMSFNHRENKEYHHHFSVDGHMDVTHDNNAHEIFSTVKHGMGHFIKKNKPNKITFTSEKTSLDKNDNEKKSSRSKLYSRLMDKHAEKHGYHHEVKDFGDSTYHTLTRKSD